MKRFTLFICFLFVLFFYPNYAFAQTEFVSDYQVTYDVDETGITTITENIRLKNLTDQYYAATFNLNIEATQISDVVASDAQGLLESSVTKEGSKSIIKVNFNQQIVGKDKSYNWVLKFKSKDFAEKMGHIWQISIPKISTTLATDNYSLTLLIPRSFGDPTTITPEPASHSDINGKLGYKFNKNQITASGILAGFGSNQVYHFNLGFNLNNNSFLPKVVKVPLPPDTNYQEVLIKKIEPEPDDVIIDHDQNYLALYKMNAKTFIRVNVEGLAKLDFKSRYKEGLNEQQAKVLTTSQNFWEKDNPSIKSKLKEIFKDSNPGGNKQKADLINQFVVNYLKYNEKRVKTGDFERLGSLTALNNPDNALCQEFTDLFIALARAAGIPTRELVGYASSSNVQLRPLSLDNTLHSWLEYYDPDFGWLMIDPTWQNTSGGVDYFNKSDLYHLTFVKRGESSLDPTLPNSVGVEFTEVKFTPFLNINLDIKTPNELYAGFPSTIKFIVKNTGSQLVLPNKLTVNAGSLKLSSNEVDVDMLPPFGQSEFKFNLKPIGVLDTRRDLIQVKYANYTAEKEVIIKPFFVSRAFPFVAILVPVGFFMFYFITLHLHRTKFRTKYHRKGKN